MKKTLFISMIFILQLSHLLGQNNIQFKAPSVVTPNAAALGKYVDIPVSYHTGVPNISIPIHTVAVGNLSLPVSLSYHSSGIKVSEIASNVGLGWVLNAGGVITQTVMGRPDDWDNGIWKTGYNRNLFDNPICNQYTRLNGSLLVRVDDTDASYDGKVCYDCNDSERDIQLGTIRQQRGDSVSFCFGHFPAPPGKLKIVFRVARNQAADVAADCQQTYKDALNGLYDAEPDVFSFNFGGYSGKFMFNGKGENGTDKNLKIISGQDIKIIPYNENGEFSRWVATTPDGTKYFFGKYENANNSIFEYSVGSALKTSTTWYLVRIESANQDNAINLEYEESNQYFVPYMGGQSMHREYRHGQSFGGMVESAPPYPYNSTVWRPRRISKVTTSDNSSNVEFFADTDREDLSGKAITKIKINFGNDEKCKEYRLTYDYFISPSNPNTYYTSSSKRLKLLSVQEYTCDGSNSLAPHIFTYNETPMPNRLSLAVDAWGYYNGQENNTGLLPRFDSYGVQMNPTPWYGDRSPHTENMKACILTKIQYPTGGYTEFEHEAHQANTGRMVGGLRIKKLTFKATSNDVATQKTFDYSGGGNLYSASSEFYDVVDFTLLTGGSSNSTNYGNQGGRDQLPQVCNFGAIYFSDLRPPLQSTQGYHIGYSVVSVSNGDGSLSTFRFLNPHPNGWQQSYPFVPTQEIPGMGSLIGEEHKNAQGQIISKTDLEYELANIGFIRGKRIALLGTAPSAEFSSPTYNTSLSVCWRGHQHPIFNFYTITTGHFRLIKKTEVVDNITTITEHKYRPDFAHHNPIETITYDSKGDTYISKTLYAHDITPNHPNFTIKNEIISKNMVGIPLESKSYKGTTFIGGGILALGYFNSGKLYPSKYYMYDKNGSINLKATIESYTNLGQPYTVRRNGFDVVDRYNWDGSKLISIANIQSSNQQVLLQKQYSYIPLTMLLSGTIDENGLRKKFYYDPFLRLQRVEDRMKDDGTDIQATINYQYQYKDANNLFNFVGTTTSFKDGRGGTKTLSDKQFFDGLGRPIGSIKENYTPSGKHLKTVVTYDAQGRQDKVYQPFESPTLGFEMPPANTLFTKTEYEASPLSRPIRQYAENGTFVETRYSANTSDDAVLTFTTGNRQNDDILVSVTPSSAYNPNTLFKTIVWNENGAGLSNLENQFIGRTEVFKDKLGRVVLTRKYLQNNNNAFDRVDTYNVYDQYGNLVMVIPPGAINASNQVIYSLTFQYVFDEQNRLIEKKIPGAKFQKFYYDNRDLLTLTQDGNMRNATYGGQTDKYLATEYDVLGRPIKTGWVYTSNPSATAQNPTIAAENILTKTEFYANKSWVKHQGAKVLKPNNVSTLRDFVWSYQERRPGLEYTGNPIWVGKQHLLSETYRYGWQLIDDDSQPINDNDYTGTDWSVAVYDGLQKPITTYRYLYSQNSVQNVYTINDVQFDDGYRVQSHKLTYGLQGAGFGAPVTLANMVYNAKDQLIQKNIGGVSGGYLQNIDYGYNTRGWLTNINNTNVYNSPLSINVPQTPSSFNQIIEMAGVPFMLEALTQQGQSENEEEQLPPPPNANEDLFSQNIYYHGADARYGATPQYNGNIQATAWQVAGRAAQGYGFSYDNLDRLTEARYFDLTNSGTTTNFSTDSKFNEKQTYDLRGNILTLQRNGWRLPAFNPSQDVAGNYGLIDNLIYSYNTQNQVTKITDNSGYNTKGFRFANSGQSEDYSYDDNGNLIADKNKNITKIEYNYLNLPQRIEFTLTSSNKLGVIEFVYDATGAKLRKIVSQSCLNPAALCEGDASNTYDYVNGVEYKNGALERVAHAEGSLSKNAHTGAFEQEYVLRDHLGNTRVTFSDSDNDGHVTAADIKQINHYYPFGLNMEGNWNGAQGNNKYQYNEKEWNDDFGLGWNDYGARMYDPAMSRWVAVDPLAEKYMRWSAYNYTLGNPIKYIDPDGMQVKYDWDAHDRGEKGVYYNETLPDGKVACSFGDALAAMKGKGESTALSFSFSPIPFVDINDPSMTPEERQQEQEFSAYSAAPGQEADPSDYLTDALKLFGKIVESSNTNDPEQFMDYIQANNANFCNPTSRSGQIMSISHIEGYLFHDKDNHKEGEGPRSLDNPNLKKFYGKTEVNGKQIDITTAPLTLPIPWSASRGEKLVYRGFLGYISGSGKTINFYLGFATNRRL